MVGDVVFDERADEVVAVVVARFPVQRQRLARCPARRLEQIGMQLLGEKFIGQALVNQDRRSARALLDERGGIVLLPQLSVFTEVPAESLDSPWALHRCADRRER